MSVSVWFQYSQIYWDLFFALVCDLSWWMFHMRLKKMYSLLCLMKGFTAILSPCSVMCYLSPVFPYCVSVWSIHCCKWGLKVPTVTELLSASPFMSVNICLCMFRGSFVRCISFTNVTSSCWIDPFIFMLCFVFAIVFVLKYICLI